MPSLQSAVIAKCRHCERSEAISRHCEEQRDEADVVTAQDIRLYLNALVACFLLPPILANMRQALPEVTVALVVSNDVSNLLRREADIALRMVRPEQSSLIAKRIGHISIQACAHSDYLQRKGTPMQAADLVSHDLIAGDHNSDVELGFEAQGFARQDLRFALRSDDLIAQWVAVKAGLGVGFMADYLLSAGPSVQTLLPELELPQFPMWLTVHRELQTSARIRAVYDFLAHEVAHTLVGSLNDSSQPGSKNAIIK